MHERTLCLIAPCAYCADSENQLGSFGRIRWNAIASMHDEAQDGVHLLWRGLDWLWYSVHTCYSTAPEKAPLVQGGADPDA